MRAFLFSLSFIAFSGTAFAQIDPSSALLLNNGKRPAVRDNGLDSGRYTVKGKSDSSTKQSEARASRKVVQPSAEPAPTPTQGAQQPNVPVAAEEAQPSSSVSEAGAVEQSRPTASTPESANQIDEARDLRRLNLLEISVAPAFIYNNSDSSYFYRRYYSGGPAVAFDAKVWLSPGFGLSGSYLGSMGAHVNDSTDGSRSALLSQQWFNLGIRSRKFFGETPVSPSLTLGLDYLDYQFRVPTDAIARARLATTGVLLSVEAELPASSYRMWTLAFQIGPKLQHKEKATGVDFQSGSSVDANLVGLSIGNRYQFDRAHAIYWKVSHTVEKDMFSGDATLADPVAGNTPAGVGVTNSFTVLQLGYSWGN